MSQPMSQADQQKAAEEAKKQEEMRESMISQILSPEAKERLGRIKLVKPEKARQVEDMLIMMARQHNLAAQVSDDQFKEMLDKVSHADEPQEVKIVRRGKADDAWDDDDEGWA